jgi:hypothetical protein
VWRMPGDPEPTFRGPMNIPSGSGRSFRRSGGKLGTREIEIRTILRLADLGSICILLYFISIRITFIIMSEGPFGICGQTMEMEAHGGNGVPKSACLESISIEKAK